MYLFSLLLRRCRTVLTTCHRLHPLMHRKSQTQCFMFKNTLLSLCKYMCRVSVCVCVYVCGMFPKLENVPNVIVELLWRESEVWEHSNMLCHSNSKGLCQRLQKLHSTLSCWFLAASGSCQWQQTARIKELRKKVLQNMMKNIQTLRRGISGQEASRICQEVGCNWTHQSWQSTSGPNVCSITPVKPLTRNVQQYIRGNKSESSPGRAPIHIRHATAQQHA